MSLKKSASAGKVFSLSVIYRRGAGLGGGVRIWQEGLPMRQLACGFGGNFARPQASVRVSMGGRTGKHGRAYG